MKTKLFLLSFFLIGGLLLAQRGEAFGWRMFENMNLSEQQKEEIAKIQKENAAKLIDLRAEMQKERLKLHDILSQDKIDEKAYFETTKKIREIRNQMFDIHSQARLKSAQVLTKEQRKQMNMGMFGKRNFGPKKGGFKWDSRGLNPNCPYY